VHTKYDVLIVGAGLYGSTFAYCAKAAGKRCMVLEKREHLAGNAFTGELEGIRIHKYGAHIFHTNSTDIWNFTNKFVRFNRFTNSPIANYRGEIFNLPFNMNTFNQMWGVVTPQEAMAVIAEQRKSCYTENPRNLEEQALNLVGKDIYEKLIRGYTEKQWGRACMELPADIIRRLPVRYTYDNNYFDAAYQGIPVEGYTTMVERMLDGIEVCLGVDYLADKSRWDNMATLVVYTGPIDAYFKYCLGALEYRSLRFETEMLDIPNYQGSAVVNYTDRETPYTRIIEHKHFEFGEQDNTVITREYSQEWSLGKEPYYPVRDARNQELYGKYLLLAQNEPCTIFGGRLGEYQYFDMDQVIANALAKAGQILAQ
jgi:UDP-galactopyranose mutase